MKYIFICVTVLSFFMLLVFLFTGDSYHAGLAAAATGIAALLVTTYNEKE